MSDDERRVLNAALTLARAVRAYNAIIDRPSWSATAPDYIVAANAMDAAEDALCRVAAPLLDAPDPAI